MGEKTQTAIESKRAKKKKKKMQPTVRWRNTDDYQHISRTRDQQADDNHYAPKRAETNRRQ